MASDRDKTFNELVEENLRLRLGIAQPDQIGSSKTTGLIWAAVVLSVAGVVATAVIVVGRPEKDNTPIITIIIGFLVPTVLALIGAAVQQVHLAVNSRLTQLIALTAKSSKAEGQLEGAAPVADLAPVAGVPAVVAPVLVVAPRKD